MILMWSFLPVINIEVNPLLYVAIFICCLFFCQTIVYSAVVLWYGGLRYIYYSAFNKFQSWPKFAFKYAAWWMVISEKFWWSVFTRTCNCGLLQTIATCCWMDFLKSSPVGSYFHMRVCRAFCSAPFFSFRPLPSRTSIRPLSPGEQHVCMQKKVKKYCHSKKGVNIFI